VLALLAALDTLDLRSVSEPRERGWLNPDFSAYLAEVALGREILGQLVVCAGTLARLASSGSSTGQPGDWTKNSSTARRTTHRRMLIGETLPKLGFFWLIILFFSCRWCLAPSTSAPRSRRLVGLFEDLIGPAAAGQKRFGDLR